MGVGSLRSTKTCNISETVHYDGLIGSRIGAFDWYQNGRINELDALERRIQGLPSF